MNKQVAIIIDWFGIYDLKAAKAAAKADYGRGLYMLIGKAKSQKKNPKLQYIGIAKELYSRIGNGHIAIRDLSQELKIWLGEVASFGVPGKKVKKVDPMLDLAEWSHTYFLDDLPLNKKKKANPPSNPVMVYNRWWHKDYETLRVKRPHPDWPDLIDYIGKEYGAKIVWFGGAVDKWKPSDFSR